MRYLSDWLPGPPKNSRGRRGRSPLPIEHLEARQVLAIGVTASATDAGDPGTGQPQNGSADGESTTHAAMTVAPTTAASTINSSPYFGSGLPFTSFRAQYFAPVGDRLPEELKQGKLVADILQQGDPVADLDPDPLYGIAITVVNGRFGQWQYTMVANPAASDWINMDAAGVVTGTSALLLKADASTRVRLVSTLVPHHEGTVEQGILPLESSLRDGLTFRLWDQTSGQAGQRADSQTYTPGSAFSAETRPLDTFFEARLWRHFNQNAALNVYTLEAEFKSLAAANNPAFEDRSTDAWTGFTVILSPVPPVGIRHRSQPPNPITSPLYRLYFGVQFNADGTETDMGYRYLTSNLTEAETLEGLGPEVKRPNREGAYFRELGVNNGTAKLGYLFASQQSGTSQMSQVYRTDAFNKPTRPAGTQEGSTPTTTTSQEQGDHVYTTNTIFETSQPGTWRVEESRGFVRELSPNPTGINPAQAAAAQAQPVQAELDPATPATASQSAIGAKFPLPLQPTTAASTGVELLIVPKDDDLSRRVALPNLAIPAPSGSTEHSVTTADTQPLPNATLNSDWRANPDEDPATAATHKTHGPLDTLFAEFELLVTTSPDV